MGSGCLTSQTAQSLEALASVKSPTKSSVFDMASFTCLTTVKQREEVRRGEGGGERRRGRREEEEDGWDEKKERLKEKI